MNLDELMRERSKNHRNEKIKNKKATQHKNKFSPLQVNINVCVCVGIELSGMTENNSGKDDYIYSLNTEYCFWAITI